jgi:hypothetical protein
MLFEFVIACDNVTPVLIIVLLPPLSGVAELFPYVPEYPLRIAVDVVPENVVVSFMLLFVSH